MARDDPHFRLRVPAALKADIEAAAEINNRSINAEVVARLERTFKFDLPEALLNALDQQAALVNQSLSDEVRWRLEASLAEKSVLTGGSDDPKDYIQNIEEKLDEVTGTLWGLKRLIARSRE